MCFLREIGLTATAGTETTIDGEIPERGERAVRIGTGTVTIREGGNVRQEKAMTGSTGTGTETETVIGGIGTGIAIAIGTGGETEMMIVEIGTGGKRMKEGGQAVRGTGTADDVHVLVTGWMTLIMRAAGGTGSDRRSHYMYSRPADGHDIVSLGLLRQMTAP